LVEAFLQVQERHGMLAELKSNLTMAV